MHTQSARHRSTKPSRTRSLAALTAATAIALSCAAPVISPAHAEPMEDNTPAGIDTTHNGGDGVRGPVVHYPTCTGACALGGGA